MPIRENELLPHPQGSIWRPVLWALGIELALVILLGAAGTILFLTGQIGRISPVVVVYLPVAAGLVIVLTAKRRFRALGFRAPEAWRVQWMVPLVVVLAALGIAVGGFRLAPAEQLLYFVVLALLIGFVEETIFRGIILHLFLPHGATTAVVWSSVLFSLAHAINLLDGRSWAQTALQIGYSLAVGFMLAALVLVTRSIWPGIVFHVINDLIQFLGAGAGTGWADVLILTLVVGSAVFLLATLHTRRRLAPGTE